MRAWLTILFTALLGGLCAQESGAVIITEIMYNAASSEATSQTQFIELANTTGSAIDLDGWTLDDEDGDGPNVLPPITLPGYGVAVICGSSAADFAAAWGTPAMLISLLDLGQIMISIANSPSPSNEIIQLRDGGGTLVDEVNLDDEGDWPSDPGGLSVHLNLPNAAMTAAANNLGANWANSGEGVAGAWSSIPAGVWGAVEVGSPGTVNGDASLPVALAAFTARGSDNRVVLDWETASELNNMGFEILRAEGDSGAFRLYASYEDTPALRGRFNSQVATRYRFEDPLARNGRRYGYKLIDVDVNGVRTAHGPVWAMPRAGAAPEDSLHAGVARTFRLEPAFPNPFNPATTLRFELPAGRSGKTPVVVTVHNVLGQPVRTLLRETLGAGTHAVSWSGRDAAGEAVPAGVYFMRLATPLLTRTQKVVYLP